MKQLFAFALLISCLSLVAQTDTFIVKKSFRVPDDEKIYTFCEQMPEFPGGEQALRKFIAANINYPQMERDNGISGNVLVRFVVNEDGSISNPLVTKKVSPGLDKEALRVLKLLPRFFPGRQQGKAVKVYFNLPVSFVL